MSERPSQPSSESDLPPELAAFLQTQDRACLFQATADHGTVAVIKLPAADIDSTRGPVPIRLRHELYDHPAAPVIRTVLTIYDQPANPLALETFSNVQDPDQRAEFAALAEQQELVLLLYDEQVRQRLAKRVPLRDHAATIEAIVAQAQDLAARIPADAFDFDAAKQAVLERTRL